MAREKKISFSLVILLSTLVLSSCKTYIDVTEKSIRTDYMTFRYQKKYNEFDYFSKVNGVADKEVFYKTHFTIDLPKNIVYWMMLDNKFYYEYDSKQLIYIYTSYKNQGKQSDNWELKDMDKGAEWEYFGEYWNQRGYDEKELNAANSNRITKLYTNGRYEILLYNVKEKNYNSFLGRVKSFKVK